MTRRDVLNVLNPKYIGMESMPKPKVETEENKDEVAGDAKKWIETVGPDGVKTSIGVFAGESDEDAIARAKAIDERLDQ